MPSSLGIGWMAASERSMMRRWRWARPSPAVDEESLAVGATMGYERGHAAQDLYFRALAVRVVETCDAAHGGRVVSG